MSLKLFFVPLSIVIAIVAGIWYIKPQWQKVNGLKKELAKQEKSLTDLKNKEGHLRSAVEDYHAVESDHSYALSAITRKIDADALIAEISKITSDRGVVLNDINISEEEREVPASIRLSAAGLEDVKKTKKSEEDLNLDYVGANEVSVGIFGNYTHLLELLREIESLSRFAQVTNVEITKVSDESGGARDLVEAKISMKVFSKKDNNEIKISKAIASNDPVMKGLITGKNNKDFIEVIKKRRNKALFDFQTGIGNAGKENIFLW